MILNFNGSDVRENWCLRVLLVSLFHSFNLTAIASNSKRFAICIPYGCGILYKGSLFKPLAIAVN